MLRRAVATLAPFGLLMMAVVSTITVHDAASDSPPSLARATFHPDGTVDLPVGYRQWTHVGTRYKPDGTSILDGLPLKVPEILNAYVEPGAMASFARTGKWPDGTQIVKEMSAIEVGNDCNATTRICGGPTGDGIFEARFMGLGLMVKDAGRFADAPGYWAYFSFGHKSPPYDSTSPARAKSQCELCHVALAAETDYVFSRVHLGTR